MEALGLNPRTENKLGVVASNPNTWEAEVEESEIQMFKVSLGDGSVGKVLTGKTPELEINQ